MLQLVTALPHIIETREVIEQRIARNRRQDGTGARVTQQLEQQRVRLARARGQHHLSRWHADSPTFELAGHCFTRRDESQRLRGVGQAFRGRERCEQTSRVRKIHARGIGHGEVEDRRAIADTRERGGNSIRVTMRRNTVREHPA